MKVSILGTEYTIKVIEPTEDMQKNGYVGLCSGNDSVITVVDFSKMAEFKDATEKELRNVRAETLRHEITHAFFNESGLKESACVFDGPWVKNEELVDWLAIQGPKIMRAWKEAGCLD